MKIKFNLFFLFFIFITATFSTSIYSEELKNEDIIFMNFEEDTPKEISVNAKVLYLKKGEKCNLIVSILPASSKNKNVIWASSDRSVVDVNNEGFVTAYKTGEAVITATTEVNRLNASCVIKVVESPKSDNTIYDILNFSEWNMVTNTKGFAEDGFNSEDMGGNLEEAAAYMARWDGVVLEKDDPYPQNYMDASQLYYEVDSVCHVQEVIYLPDKENPLDNEKIKNSIVKYGGVSASYKSTKTTYNNTDPVKAYFYKNNCLTYYHPEEYLLTQNELAGHSITIVGWDDNYPKESFSVTPPGDGAFICKNSWGNNIGENGYFYISYYDKYLFKYSTGGMVTKVEGKKNYDTIFQYDPLGAITCWNWGGRSSLYAANVFPESGKALESDHTLKAVSFFNNYENIEYEIYVVKDYKNKDSLNNLGEVIVSGVMEEMGYHTIELPEEINLSKGTRFAVAIKFSTEEGEKLYIPIEFPYTLSNGTPYSTKAKANYDESYIKASGGWFDLMGSIENGNNCIKAFTDNCLSDDSVHLYSAIDNDREYVSDKVYTVDELLKMGAVFSDEFIEYNNEMELNLLSVDDIDNEVIPSALMLFSDNENKSDDEMILPSRYDLRDFNAVSSVKNQGSYGTCWAHATYGSMESIIIKKSKSIEALQGGDLTLDKILDEVNKEVEVEKIYFINKNIKSAVGDSFSLKSVLKIEPYNCEDFELNWNSTNKNVATVDEYGNVKAVSPGVATISVYTDDGDLSDVCKITVQNGLSVNGIEICSFKNDKEIGDEFILDYKIYPEVSKNKNVIWRSLTPDIATVNNNGVVTALSEGLASIEIVSVDGNKKDVADIYISGKKDLNIRDIEYIVSDTGYEIDLLTTDIYNNSNSYIRAKIIASVYNKNVLVGMVEMNNYLNPGKNIISFNNIELPEYINNDYSIKIFVWDENNLNIPLAYNHEENIKK